MLKLLFGMVWMTFSVVTWALTSQAHQGETYFFEYCGSCHSLKYISSDSIKTHQSLLHRGYWRSSLRPKDAINWFGQIPPDLSLEAQRHSKAWITDYLLGFYDDSQHRLGRNNHVFKDVAMPDVLYQLGEKRPQVVADLVVFLDEVAHPEQKNRYLIGLGVMFICFFALCLAWRIKKLFKDLHD